MFESEVYPTYKSLNGEVPESILKKFKETGGQISHTSDLHWSEHCTECAMPQCFKTCDLYTPRVDGKCQRFVNGIERLAETAFTPDYLLKIRFKKWGVLETQGNITLYEGRAARKQSTADLRRNSLLRYLPKSILKKYLVKLIYTLKKKEVIKAQNKGKVLPDSFMVECYNPNEKIIEINLTIRNEDEKYRKIPFQHKIELSPGYHRYTVPFDEIDKRIKVQLPFRISLTPTNIEPEEPLYFGRMEFVKFATAFKEAKKPKADKIKCIVWDLDNTLWDGVLIEKRLSELELKAGIKEIIHQLDEKGILHSIASKNDHDHAMNALRHFELEQYFLFPEISWGPKSHGLKRIARNLNINLNTFLFVDDNPFEREEVKNAVPEVRCMDALHYKDIPDIPEIKHIVITKESKSRRDYYLREQTRKSLEASFDEDYFNFLRSCELQIELLPLTEAHHKRVYELAQRTNQMNFSGNRYTLEQIRALEQDERLDKYVIRGYDRFGDYGIVGFGIVDVSENKLVDLMFSCRIQSKRVEHAFFTHILRKYMEKGDFKVSYRQTERNKFTGQVFEDFGFSKIGIQAEISLLKYEKGKAIPDDKILKVVDLL